MITTLLVIGIIVCAFQASRSGPLPLTALWLAGASGFTALTIYGLGAHQVAVIELSVGAGLVTILLVYSINLAGHDGSRLKSVVPRWLAGFLAIAIILILLGWGLATPPSVVNPESESFATTMWVDRQLDGILQTVLIITATLTVLGLLASEEPIQTSISTAQPVTQKTLPLQPLSKTKTSTLEKQP